MSAAATDIRQRVVLGVFFLMWCMAAALLVLHVHSENGWVLGDWVIDYRQGYVRRGLIASVLAPVSKATGLSVAALVAGLLALVFGACLFFFASLLKGRVKPFWYMLLLLSPAGLIFNVYGASQVGRKELLHFAMLALFVWLLDRRKLNLPWALALGVMAVAAALSHELMLFYVPYFVVAAHWSKQGRPAYLAAFAVALGSAAAVLSLSLFAQPFDGKAFCASLVAVDGVSTSMCQGTILWPLQTLRDSLADTRLAIDYFQYPSVYGVAVLLALAPILLWLRRYEVSLLKKAWLGIAFAALFSAPLFMMAVDWGRFIQIHMVSSAMVLVLLLRRQPVQSRIASSPFASSSAASLEPAAVPAPLIAWRHAWLRRGVAGLTLLSFFAWNMPVCCQNSVGLGVIEKIGNSRMFMNVVSRYLS